MKRILPLLLLLLCAAPATAQEPAKPAPADKPEVIKAGDWTITATSTNASAINARTKEKVVLYKPMDAAESKECSDYEFSGRIISVVGTFVSVEITEGGYCGGAHPFSWHAFNAMDLARGGAPVTLAELFDRYELEDALNKDAWLIKKRAEEDTCTYSESDLTTNHFAFHHVKDGKVAVRLGLPHGCEAARNSFTQLGLYLTPAEWLSKRLTAAEKAKTLLGQRAKK
jgi:hypothetical protein